MVGTAPSDSPNGVVRATSPTTSFSRSLDFVEVGEEMLWHAPPRH